MKEWAIKLRKPYHPRRPLEPLQSPMGIVCIGGTEVCRAGCYGHRTQPVNHVGGGGLTYDIGMKDYFANDMGASRYQKINSVLEVVEEISRQKR